MQNTDKYNEFYGKRNLVFHMAGCCVIGCQTTRGRGGGAVCKNDSRNANMQQGETSLFQMSECFPSSSLTFLFSDGWGTLRAGFVQLRSQSPLVMARYGISSWVTDSSAGTGSPVAPPSLFLPVQMEWLQIREVLLRLSLQCFCP